jgi:ABC-type transporter Mla MlaB component
LVRPTIHFFFDEVAMLRVTRIDSHTNQSIIKLEGKLLSPWVNEVRAACKAAQKNAGQAQLDLSHLTYVDMEGSRLLAELRADGTELTNCSNYVATLLGRETHS